MRRGEPDADEWLPEVYQRMPPGAFPGQSSLGNRSVGGERKGEEESQSNCSSFFKGDMPPPSFGAPQPPF